MNADSILSAISDMVVILDTDLKILDQNNICREKAGDHKGEYCYSVFENRSRACEDCPVKSSFKDERSHTCERIRDSETDKRYLEIKGSSFRDPDSKIMMGVEIIRDITGYKNIEKRLIARESQQTAIAEIEYNALTGFELNLLMDVSANLVTHTLGIDRCLILENRENGFVYSTGIGWDKNIFPKPLKDPITNYAILTEEPLIIDNIPNDPRFRSTFFNVNNIISSMSVRIGERKTPFGVLIAQSTLYRKFTDDEIHFLQIVANVLAEAIKRKSAENALRSAKERAENAEKRLMMKERQQTAIAEIEYNALTGFEFDVLMDVAVNLVVNTMEIERCLILEKKQDNFVFCAGIGWDRKIISTLPKETIMNHALLSEEPIIIEENNNDPRLSSFFKENGIKSIMTVCMGELKNPFGVISVQSKNVRKFTDDEVHFFQVVSNVLSEAIKRKSVENALKSAKEQAEEASKAKTRFLFTVGHELRTPLNAIIGFSELLKQKIPGDLNEKQEHYIDSIINSGNNQLKNINNILEVAKIDKELLKTEKISLSLAVDDVLERMKEKVFLRNILIIKELDPQYDLIFADILKFKQVLTHLFDNAIKFNIEGGKVIIGSRKEETMIKISISDTGIGIKQEDKMKLFKSFEQLDASLGRKYGGMGIGLLISKQIIEQHGGRLEVESIFGKGSTFSIFLPFDGKI